MSKRLDSVVALVTGASSGIGHATAEQLAAEGAAVAVVARRRDRLAELVARIEKKGGTAVVIAADLTDAGAAAAVVAETVERLGRLDVLVNAAGVMLNGDSVTTPVEDWEAMVDINLRGVLYTTKAALPYLLDAVKNGPRDVADVVTVSSVAGRLAAPTVAVYNATKFAVTAATESWRQEFTTRGIRFAAVEPGATSTELWDHEREEAAKGSEVMFDGVERMHPEDVADAIHYIVTKPRRVAINEILIRPTDQA